MKVTIKDIAKEANVSTATVSKVLNNKDQRISSETRALVLKIAKEKKYIRKRPLNWPFFGDWDLESMP